MRSLSGGKCMHKTEDLGIKLENVQPRNLGRPIHRHRALNNDHCRSGWKSGDIHVSRLIKSAVRIEETTSDYDRNKLQERLASWLVASLSSTLRGD